MALIEYGRRTQEWRRYNDYPDTVEASVRKLAEEVGELATAVGGLLENRTGRGDPLLEAADVILTVCAVLAACEEADLMDKISYEGLEDAMTTVMRLKGI